MRCLVEETAHILHTGRSAADVGREGCSGRFAQCPDPRTPVLSTWKSSACPSGAWRWVGNGQSVKCARLNVLPVSVSTQLCQAGQCLCLAQRRHGGGAQAIDGCAGLAGGDGSRLCLLGCGQLCAADSGWSMVTFCMSGCVGLLSDGQPVPRVHCWNAVAVDEPRKKQSLCLAALCGSLCPVLFLP